MSRHQPLVILIIGLQGSGKTTLAEILSPLLGLPTISTEKVRNALFLPTNTTADIDFTPDELRTTYRAVTYFAERLTTVGRGVIVEGVFRSMQQREAIAAFCQGQRGLFVGVALTCPRPEAIRRLTERKRIGVDVAPGGPVTLDRVAEGFAPPSSEYLTFDTGQLRPGEVVRSLVADMLPYMPQIVDPIGSSNQYDSLSTDRP